MHRRTLISRTSCSSSRRFNDDRYVASQHHKTLLDKKNWELSTPSRSLPVLGVLTRSGVFVDGIEGAASHSLASMTPFMTSSERSMLHRVSLFFSGHHSRGSSANQRRPSLAAASPKTHAQSSRGSPREEARCREFTAVSVNQAVVSMYAAACSKEQHVVSQDTPLDNGRLYSMLSLPCALMLLELIVSRSLDAEGVQHMSLRLVLERVHALLITESNEEKTQLDFRTVWWLLMVLQGDPRWFRVRVPPCDGRAVYMCCVRFIHHKLPTMSVEEVLLAYLLLTSDVGGFGDAKEYPRAFVVIHEAEQRIATIPASDFDLVSTDTLLGFMSSSLVEKMEDLWPELCLGWYRTEDRITDMTTSQTRRALHILSRLHMKMGRGQDAITKHGTHAEWQALHDSVFAQLFVSAADFGMSESVAILEDTEVIHISPMGISAPSTFLERMKARTFDAMKTVLRKLTSPAEQQFSEEDVAMAYEAALRFEALLHRYTLVPCSDRDTRIISRCVDALRRHAFSTSPKSE